MKAGWNGSDYAKNSSAQAKWAEELIAQLSLTGNEHLLDIGCGDGKITAAISRILDRGLVVGIDASENMIAEAKKEHAGAFHRNLSFICMDATKIDLQQKFDIAFSNAALHWIKDHGPVLSATRHHLQGKKKILFQMGGSGNAEEISAVIDSMTKQDVWKKYYSDFAVPYYFYGIEQYEEWLPEYKYKPARIELILKDMVHDGVDGLKGWLRTTWFPYTDMLPVHKRELFFDQVVRDYTDIVPVDSEGRTHVKMMRLEVEAYAC